MEAIDLAIAAFMAVSIPVHPAESAIAAAPLVVAAALMAANMTVYAVPSNPLPEGN